jgi:phage terminase large subunit-like protein
VSSTPLTLAELATLGPGEAAAAIKRLSPEAAETLLWDWTFRARAEQLAPPDPWQTWVLLAGRGFGKTRTGAEWVRDRVKRGFRRIGLIAPTAGDARDVMVEGESGLLSVCWPKDRTNAGEGMGRPHYEPSKRRVTWANGAMCTLYSADEPERLRGPQHDTIWADELAAWRYCRESWDMSQFGLRLGDNPQALVTTTPKPISVLREILKEAGTVITRGSTFDNRANLARPFFDKIVARYKGTRLGRQELYAELLEEAEGALWKRALIEACARPAPENLARIVVAIDPAITAKAESNETGIVVAGMEAGHLGHGYVLGDCSGRLTPGDWGARAVQAYHDFGADRIVAEGNQGGEMVRHTIHTIDANLPVRIVHASRGKAARAEPVAALYEQGRIHHAGPLPELEDQLVTWEPLSGMESPDRLDALVWALTDLFLGGSVTRRVGVGPEVIT